MNAEEHTLNDGMLTFFTICINYFTLKNCLLVILANIIL